MTDEQRIPSTLETWWSMIKAGAEIDGEVIKPDMVILNYSGNGASCMVTAAQLDEHFELLLLVHLRNEAQHNLITMLERSKNDNTE